MWDRIKLHYGDLQCLCPNTGEVWQYLGSTEISSEMMKDRGFIFAGEIYILHYFRHRSLYGERVCFEIVDLFEPIDLELPSSNP